MHFWIDKRSQACGFGRSRVAASLSGSSGVGLGFNHPPRRMANKSVIAPTIHRTPQQTSSSTVTTTEGNRINAQNNIINNSNNSATHSNLNSNVNRSNRNRNNIVVNTNGSSNTTQIYHENSSHYNLPSNSGGGLLNRHYQNPSESVYNQNIQRSPLISVNNHQECSFPITLPHIYG